jgi:hypothetical protein
MFTLTKPEQRLVVLILLALLTAAFVRYWRDVHSPYAPKPAQGPSEATPLASPQNPLQFEEAEETSDNETRPQPSPQSSQRSTRSQPEAADASPPSED